MTSLNVIQASPESVSLPRDSIIIVVKIHVKCKIIFTYVSEHWDLNFQLVPYNKQEVALFVNNPSGGDLCTYISIPYVLLECGFGHAPRVYTTTHSYISFFLHELCMFLRDNPKVIVKIMQIYAMNIY